jgi:hypothetical protein
MANPRTNLAAGFVTLCLESRIKMWALVWAYAVSGLAPGKRVHVAQLAVA